VWVLGCKCHSPSMCANRALASSAAFAASLGRMKTLGTDSMAATERISFEHLQATWEKACLPGVVLHSWCCSRGLMTGAAPCTAGVPPAFQYVYMHEGWRLPQRQESAGQQNTSAQHGFTGSVLMVDLLEVG
jgi:hypothetical protein